MLADAQAVAADAVGMEHGLLAEFDAFRLAGGARGEQDHVAVRGAVEPARRAALEVQRQAQPASAPSSGCSLASASRRISSTMACFAASPLGIDQHQMLARAHDRIDQAEVAVAVVEQHADTAAGMRGDLLGEGIDLAVGVAPGVFQRSLRLAGVDQERPPRVGAAEMAEGAVERYGYGRLLMPAPQRFSAVKAWMSKFTATCGALSISRTAAMKRSA